MTVNQRFDFPDLGLGVGLRACHFDHVLDAEPAVDWFEIITENYLGEGGRNLDVLDRVSERFPIAMHGVSLSIGSTDPLDFEYLARVKTLAERCAATWLGDHICWTGVLGENSHDLLPKPYTEPGLAHLVERIRTVQDFLERPLVLENPSTYVAFQSSTIPEGEFVARMAEEADCALLLDVNNVWVSCRNQGLDPDAWLDAVPYERVAQIHLAGFTDKGTHFLDTHSKPVTDDVWRLYVRVVERMGPCATLLEWDEDIPTFDVLEAEVRKALRYRTAVAGGA